jgi:hypothetical protein
MNSKVEVLTVTLGVVLVVALIVGGIVFGVQQGTIRRQQCVENDGTWFDGKCLILRPGTALDE